MKRKSLVFCFALFLTVAMLLNASPVFAKKILIKCQQAYPQSLPTLGREVVWFADELKSVSGGEINVKIYDPGKLVKPFEVLDAVSDGKVDAGVAADGYFAGKVPAGNVFSSIPFGPEAGEYLAWYYYGNGQKLHQKVYANKGYQVVIQPVVLIPPETAGWFKQPVNTVEDLNGVKMRFYGYGGQAMQKLGMSITVMPGGELFAALEKGVIDATEFSVPAIDQRLGFYKLVKYNYFPGWHQQATLIHFWMNKKKWESLTDLQRKMIEITCKASMLNSIARGESEQGAVIKENVTKRGVKNMYWSEDLLKAFYAKWEEVQVEMSQKDPDFKMAYEDLKAFREEYKYWQGWGYLPRNCKK